MIEGGFWDTVVQTVAESMRFCTPYVFRAYSVVECASFYEEQHDSSKSKVEDPIGLGNAGNELEGQAALLTGHLPGRIRAQSDCSIDSIQLITEPERLCIRDDTSVAQPDYEVDEYKHKTDRDMNTPHSTKRKGQGSGCRARKEARRAAYKLQKQEEKVTMQRKSVPKSIRRALGRERRSASTPVAPIIQGWAWSTTLTTYTSEHLDKFPRESTAWKGLRCTQSYQTMPQQTREPDVADEPVILHPDCDDEVVSLVHVDGWKYITNTATHAQVLVDKVDRIFAVKARPPRNQQSWQAVVDAMTTWMGILSRDLVTDRKCWEHSRGNHACFTMGVTFGNGEKRPGHRKIAAENMELIRRFRRDIYVRRYVRHIAVVFATWFPHHHRHYTNTQMKLRIVDNLIQQVFPSSPFCSHSVNLGARVSCEWHRDLMNLVWGLCAVGVLGKFDHRTSGHLMLKEPKIIIELAPGDIFLFPSGAVTHKNSSLVNPDDTRFSFVQSSAAGLFRWVHQGHQTEDILTGREKTERDKWKAVEGSHRWARACDSFLTWDYVTSACECFRR